MDLNEVIRRIRPCNQNHPYIFISYSSNDRDLVWRDVLEFQRRGYNIWLDEKNLDKTKDSWKEDALKSIEDMDCELLVLYVSASSLCSRACFNEYMKTMDQVTCDLHNGPVKFIAVDAEEIGNIISYKDKVYESVRSKKIDKTERSEQIKILSGFVREAFNNNNEKVRIHPKNEKNRKLDYYEDILAAFPDSTRLTDEETQSVVEEERESAEEAEAAWEAAEEEEARKATEEAEVARKAAEEEAARKATEEKAARKAAEEEAARKAAEEEAAKEEEAARKAAEEEAARKAAEEEAAQKAAEEETARKAAEEAEVAQKVVVKSSSCFWEDTCLSEAEMNPTEDCFVSVNNFQSHRFDVVEEKRTQPHLFISRYGVRYSKVAEPTNVPKTLTGTFGRSYCEGNVALRSIGIPYGVQELDMYCFKGCSELQSVVLPYGLTRIGNECFNGCRHLDHIDLPPQLRWLGRECFYSSGLRWIVIPGSVKTIPPGAFYACKDLTTVVLKDGVKELGSGAFARLHHQCHIWIPDSVRTIEPTAFGIDPDYITITIHCHKNSVAQAYAEENHLSLVLYD